jgi:hypothetical protein
VAIYDDIRAAFETRLVAEASLSSFPKSFENVSFEPTTGIAFIKCSLLPTSRRSAVRGLNPQQLYKGVFRVFCYGVEGQGPSTTDTMADKVIVAFNATTDVSFTNSDAETIIVSVDYAERGMGFVDTPWYYTVVNLGWHIYAA